MRNRLLAGLGPAPVSETPSTDDHAVLLSRVQGLEAWRTAWETRLRRNFDILTKWMVAAEQSPAFGAMVCPQCHRQNSVVVRVGCYECDHRWWDRSAFERPPAPGSEPSQPPAEWLRELFSRPEWAEEDEDEVDEGEG